MTIAVLNYNKNKNEIPKGEGKEFVLYRLEDQQIQPDYLALSWKTTNDALSGLALQSLTNNNTYSDDEVHR